MSGAEDGRAHPSGHAPGAERSRGRRVDDDVRIPTTRDVPPEQQTFYCDLCGNEMLNLHCKLVCEQCGYKRDCSDP